ALARTGYGPRSTAFAEASLAAGLAALRTNGFAAAERAFDAACGALPADEAARDGVRGELRARVLGARATLALARGRFRVADSLAAEVLVEERTRTRGPSAARAWAWRVLGTTRHDSSDTYYLRAIAVMDSLGAPLAVERLDAMLGHAGLLSSAGNYVAADSVAREGIRLSTIGYGARSREAAHFHAYRSEALLMRGDTTAAAAESDSALSILDALPDAVAPVRVDIMSSALTVFAARGRWREVLDRAEQLRVFGLANGAPLAVASGDRWVVRAMLRLGDTAQATTRIREALAASTGGGLPAATGRELRVQLDTLRARGFDRARRDAAPE
ncbi:MAG TPA: hypothetical protein VGD56_08780, partial [Gemmatirosa sp.]